MAQQAGMIDSAIFENLQVKIDEETVFRDKIHDIVQELDKRNRATQAILSKVHSVPESEQRVALAPAHQTVSQQVESIRELSKFASTQPYYKYNHIWTRSVQDACFTILFWAWTGVTDRPGGTLVKIEEMSGLLDVPVNVKDEDKFHLTIEEYLLALVSLIDELARLARNSVTLGDYRRPLIISRFIKDVHAGFQILNLKNDILRKRSDGIKYRVKEVEDVVYDLSLRNLLPKD